MYSVGRREGDSPFALKSSFLVLVGTTGEQRAARGIHSDISAQPFNSYPGE